MSIFDICVVNFNFRAFLGDPKFGALHLGLHAVLLSLGTVD